MTTQRFVQRICAGNINCAPTVEIKWEDSMANLWSVQTFFELSPRDPKVEDLAQYLFFEVLHMFPRKPKTSFLRKYADQFYSGSATTIDELGGKDFGLFGVIENTEQIER